MTGSAHLKTRMLHLVTGMAHLKIINRWGATVWLTPDPPIPAHYATICVTVGVGGSGFGPGHHPPSGVAIREDSLVT